jgi:hypothetical protein
MEGNVPVQATVDELIAAQLDESGPGGRAADLVLAALLGDDDLDAVLSGTTPAADQLPQHEQTAETQLTGLWLRSVEVEGFRGIGPKAALRLTAGPGLAVVAGRNGSGKSSLAELALTDDNKRWSGRTQIWRDGWRNLHTTGQSRIGIELTADGQAGVVRVTREWPEHASLDSAESTVQSPGAPRRPLAAMNWSAPLEVFRPFLSYSELGALVSGRPSDMYDALQAILGLDQLVSAEKRLGEARKRLDEPSKQADKQLPGLRSRLEAHPDGRAAAALDAVRRRPWKLDVIETLAAGGAAADDPVASRLTQVAAIGLPSAGEVAAAVERLRTADEHVTSMSGTAAEVPRRRCGAARPRSVQCRAAATGCQASLRPRPGRSAQIVAEHSRSCAVVELTKNSDPVSRYLDDARALALTTGLPADARAVVVAGFCRSALEAACHEAVRARRIKAGVRHADVERELITAPKLRQLLALALLDDVARGGDVVGVIRRRCGQAAVNAFDAARDGTHELYHGDLRHFVQETERLANAIRA